MGSIHELLKDIPIPRMAWVEQRFDGSRIDDIPAAVRREMQRPAVCAKIKPGMRLAVTAGSRGIANLAVIIREVVSFLKEKGALPFVIPAMGSHGGATAEGQLAVNLVGAANMARAVIPAMRAQGHGRILLISSVAAEAPIPFQSWYSASKAALNSYSMSLHNEVARFGISVCAVMPGDTATGFTAARQKQARGDDLYGGAISRSVAKMEKDERGGASAENVARLVARVAERKRTRPLYTAGLGYRLLAALAKLFPASACRWILGQLYAK